MNAITVADLDLSRDAPGGGLLLYTPEAVACFRLATTDEVTITFRPTSAVSAWQRTRCVHYAGPLGWMVTTYETAPNSNIYPKA